MIATLLTAALPILLQVAVSAPPVPAAGAGAASTPAPQASPAPAGAKRGGEIGYFTAGNLADRCASADGISYCFAYIAAVHDTMRAYEVWLDQKEFCPPATLAQGDLRRSFQTYMSAYPGNRSGQAASVIVVALKQTYPCVSQSAAKP